MSIRERILAPNSVLFDFSASGTLLISLCQVFGRKQMIEVIVFLFKLQELVLKDEAHQRAKEWMMMNVLVDLSRMLDMIDLTEMLIRIQQNRKVLFEWEHKMKNGEREAIELLALRFE